jgi:protein-S-isoprenylcysteine O-methyltransferase
MADDGHDNRIEAQMRRRFEAKRHPLETVPLPGQAQAHRTIPNTPLVASLISFLLGCVCTLGTITFFWGGAGWWWATHQLGFFFAAWSAFHWGEFAVTAGWNLEKCSVDCELNLQGFFDFFETLPPQFILKHFF